MPTVGYFPYARAGASVEAEWLRRDLAVTVRVATDAPSLNDMRTATLPGLERLRSAVKDFVSLPAVVAEGPGGFLWAAILRAEGFAGSLTVLPYVNPHRWLDVGAAALYGRFAHPDDRVFLGSTLSAGVYRALGVESSVGEPYGIDDRLFQPRPGSARSREDLSIPPGRLLLFAGRTEPDKDLYRLLRMGLRARLLFPDLQLVIASHVVDIRYMAVARQQLDRSEGVHFVVSPSAAQLADLYTEADVFVTASTSHFETFGRAPAEAMACGAPAVAPRYDGFVEVLAQPGGTLVDVVVDQTTSVPHVDEDALLRAVYDVLSSPRSPARHEVATIARRRFGRSNTISVLRHLVDGVVRHPVAAVPPAALELPAAWRDPVAELVSRDPLEALSWFWQGCDHGCLGTDDAAFAAGVRLALCRPRSYVGEGAMACR